MSARTVKGMFTRICLVSLLCVTVLGFSGVAGAKTTVEVWDFWGGSELYDPWWDWVITTFEERNPDIELDVQYVPGIYQVREKLILGAAGGVLPDVAQASIVTGRELYDLGLLEALNPFIDRTEDTKIDSFIPATQRYNHKGDVAYGISVVMASNALLYNTDHFEEAGLSVDPYTFNSWNDLKEAARKLAKVGADGTVERGGIQAAGASINAWAPFLHANGGEMYNADETAYTFASDQGIESLAEYVDLFNRLGVAGGNFRQGTASMWLGGNWNARQAKEANPGLNLDMANLPPGPSSDERATMTWSNMLVMIKGTEQSEEAWRYIQFATSVEANEKLVEILGRMPPRIDYYQSGHWGDQVVEAPYLRNVLSFAQSGGVYPFLSNPDVVQATNPFFRGAMDGTMAPASALRQAEEQANSVLQGE